MAQVSVHLEGGAKLIAELKDRARRYKSGTVLAGFFDSPTATIAAELEFGDPSGHLPPRPFMRVTVAEFKDAWRDQLRDNLIGATSKEVLGEVGDNMVADLTATMLSGHFAPNSPKTIDRKGFDYPLLETGKVLQPKIRRRVKMGSVRAEEA